MKEHLKRFLKKKFLLAVGGIFLIVVGVRFLFVSEAEKTDKILENRPLVKQLISYKRAAPFRFSDGIVFKNVSFPFLKAPNKAGSLTVSQKKNKIILKLDRFDISLKDLLLAEKSMPEVVKNLETYTPFFDFKEKPFESIVLAGCSNLRTSAYAKLLLDEKEKTGQFVLLLEDPCLGQARLRLSLENIPETLFSDAFWKTESFSQLPPDIRRIQITGFQIAFYNTRGFMENYTAYAQKYEDSMQTDIQGVVWSKLKEILIFNQMPEDIVNKEINELALFVKTGKNLLIKGTFSSPVNIGDIPFASVLSLWVRARPELKIMN